jgi:hypothetical protein
MFCESDGMQLSAANLLIASQQLARGGTQPPAAQPAQFASAMKESGGIDGFAPMEFKQAAAPAKAAPAPAATAQPAAYGSTIRLGANIDIRV